MKGPTMPSQGLVLARLALRRQALEAGWQDPWPSESVLQLVQSETGLLGRHPLALQVTSRHFTKIVEWFEKSVEW